MITNGENGEEEPVDLTEVQETDDQVERARRFRSQPTGDPLIDSIREIGKDPGE